MAKLYAADEKYKGHVLELLESLVKSSGSFSEEPPSLLGYLGSDCANHFVTLLSSLDKPYQDEKIETRIWNFISAVVSNKQQGILPGLMKHVENYTIEFLPADSKELITEKACKIAVAAYIARILALYIHSRKPSEKDETFFKQLLPKLGFYFEKAVKISGYRSSLHVLLQKNFEEKWSGVKLAQLKKTRLRRTVYGPDAVYDLVLGDKVLGFEPGWAGRPDGYRYEVEQANLNLSLVQTQVVSPSFPSHHQPKC
jgi:hypothetical protein